MRRGGNADRLVAVEGGDAVWKLGQLRKAVELDPERIGIDIVGLPGLPGPDDVAHARAAIVELAQRLGYAH